MTKQDTIREWRESTEDAIKALLAWRDALAEWERNGGESQAGDFAANLAVLFQAGLEQWADGNKAGDGLDVLANAVTGEGVF